MEVVSGDNWNYKACRVSVKLSPPTNRNPPYFHRLVALHVADPTASERWREKKSHSAASRSVKQMFLTHKQPKFSADVTVGTMKMNGDAGADVDDNLLV